MFSAITEVRLDGDFEQESNEMYVLLFWLKYNGKICVLYYQISVYILYMSVFVGLSYCYK